MNVSAYITFDLILNKPFKVNYSPLNIQNDDLCLLWSESCSEAKVIVENGQILAEVWSLKGVDQSNSSA